MDPGPSLQTQRGSLIVCCAMDGSCSMQAYLGSLEQEGPLPLHHFPEDVLLNIANRVPSM